MRWFSASSRTIRAANPSSDGGKVVAWGGWATARPATRQKQNAKIQARVRAIAFLPIFAIVPKMRDVHIRSRVRDIRAWRELEKPA
jgi:hypothetical protein